MENHGGDSANRDWNRREALGAAGLALLSGLAGCASRRDESETPSDGRSGDGVTSTGEPEPAAGYQSLGDYDGGTFEVDPDLNLGGHRVVSGPGLVGYDAIQSAFDAAATGDVIRVHGSYDAEAAGERFPVTLDYNRKQVALVGGHHSGSVIDASHVDENVLEVIGRGFNDYRNNPYVGRLKVVGGNVGLRVRGAPYALFDRLTFHQTGSHGAVVEGHEDEAGNSRGTFGSVFWNCLAWSCGGGGFWMDAAATPHGTTFNNCVAVWNGLGDGDPPPGVTLRGFNSRWINGVVQGNGGVGIDARSGASQMVVNTYFEGNGLGVQNPRGMYVNSTGLKVDGCYFTGHYARGEGSNGLPRAKVGVDVHAGTRAQVRNCTYRRYEDAFLKVRNARDVDVHVPSNTALDETTFLDRRSAPRLRSDGVVLPTDLRNADGAFVGDRAIHDGSGRGSFAPAVWDGSDWVTMATENRL